MITVITAVYICSLDANTLSSDTKSSTLYRLKGRTESCA